MVNRPRTKITRRSFAGICVGAAAAGASALDFARACPGLTLFSPLASDGIVYLISLDGRVVHTWKMPYPPGLYGYLTEKGTLFYNGKIPNDTFLGKAPFKGGA